ncbi:hypothetical protein [Stenotrophomonas maltophilia]|uniref:hypothetical protein n=1 Tax=Stenotrophomonas maltophilia TaxID=40324 RepID=UPI0021C85A8C|nr:hypothetical protein [Stenotrophomonas maltophilia]MCU1145796.1 hypothetical protein [Stenotrophomonas maltophilia]
MDSTATEKPPTQRLVATGIDALGAMGAGNPPPGMDLRRLAGLPPFQAYMALQEDCPAGMGADQFALERAHAAIAREGADAFLAEYVAWHRQAGSWPNETPFGEPL